MPPANPPTIAHHLILSGYGHWLPNDIRGSGSREVRQEKFAELGPIHFGRKWVQPGRQELSAFQSTAQPLLVHPVLWFDAALRIRLGQAVANVVATQGYTVWACAILSNHIHVCIRRHRDSAQMMLQRLAAASCEALQGMDQVPEGHPIWAERPYKRFLYTPQDVLNVARYIERNPVKERLGRQTWPFVVPYDGWPFHKVRKK